MTKRKSMSNTTTHELFDVCGGGRVSGWETVGIIGCGVAGAAIGGLLGGGWGAGAGAAFGGSACLALAESD